MRRLVLALMAGLALVACSHPDDERLRTGDLVFVSIPADYSLDDTDAVVPDFTGDTSRLYIHAAILEVCKDSTFVIDATLRHGVARYPLETFLKDFHLRAGRSATFEVLRPQNLTGAQCRECVENAKKFIGERYDAYFLPDNGAHYCTELIYDSYVNAQGEHLFAAGPIDFTDAAGQLPPYWSQLFGRIGAEVPSGLTGTSPKEMRLETSLMLMDKLSLTSSAPDTIDWGWENLGHSAEVGYAQADLFDGVQSIAVLRYRKGRLHLDVINDAESLADSTSAIAQKYGALAAINGSYFNMKTLEPNTYIKEDGEVEGSAADVELYRVDGLVATQGKRHIKICPCDTTSYSEMAGKYEDALAGGPMLLTGGVPARQEWPKDDNFFDFRHPRTILGESPDGWVYFIVIDGRSQGNADGTTIPECIEVCRMFGITDAINLDGGGSSTLWTAKYGVINHPTDNRHFDHFGQRRVPNILILR